MGTEAQRLQSGVNSIALSQRLVKGYVLMFMKHSYAEVSAIKINKKINSPVFKQDFDQRRVNNNAWGQLYSSEKKI